MPCDPTKRCEYSPSALSHMSGLSCVCGDLCTEPRSCLVPGGHLENEGGGRWRSRGLPRAVSRAPATAAHPPGHKGHVPGCLGPVAHIPGEGRLVSPPALCRGTQRSTSFLRKLSSCPSPFSLLDSATFFRLERSCFADCDLMTEDWLGSLHWSPAKWSNVGGRGWGSNVVMGPNPTTVHRHCQVPFLPLTLSGSFGCKFTLAPEFCVPLKTLVSDLLPPQPLLVQSCSMSHEGYYM